MHNVDLPSRCLLIEKMTDGGKEPKTIQLLKRSTIIYRSISKYIMFVKENDKCSIMNGECYDDCNVTAKRTAA